MMLGWTSEEKLVEDDVVLVTMSTMTDSDRPLGVTVVFALCCPFHDTAAFRQIINAALLSFAGRSDPNPTGRRSEPTSRRLDHSRLVVRAA